MGLSHKQQRFVEAYISTGNGTQAARDAGYSGNDNTLGTTAHKLLQRPAVKAAIHEAQAHLRQRARWSQADKLEMIERVLNGDVMETYTSKEHGPVDGPPGLMTLLRYLQEHNRMCGHYPSEKHEHTHRAVPMVNPDTPTPMIEARVIELRGENDG